MTAKHCSFLSILALLALLLVSRERTNLHAQIDSPLIITNSPLTLPDAHRLITDTQTYTEMMKLADEAFYAGTVDMTAVAAGYLAPPCTIEQFHQALAGTLVDVNATGPITDGSPSVCTVPSIEQHRGMNVLPPPR